MIHSTIDVGHLWRKVMMIKIPIWAYVVIAILIISTLAGHILIGITFAIGAFTAYFVIHFFIDEEKDMKHWREFRR